MTAVKGKGKVGRALSMNPYNLSAPHFRDEDTEDREVKGLTGE